MKSRIAQANARLMYASGYYDRGQFVYDTKDTEGQFKRTTPYGRDRRARRKNRRAR